MFRHLCLLFIRGIQILPNLSNIPNPFKLQFKKEDSIEEEEEEKEAFLKDEEETKKESGVLQEENEEEWEEIIVDIVNIYDGDKKIEEEISSSSSTNESEFSYFNLPAGAENLTKENRTKLKLMINQIIQKRQKNDRDFRELMKMIYRIFGNRFKYAVIWETFTNPPKFRTVRINKNILIPKKALPLYPIDIKLFHKNKGSSQTKIFNLKTISTTGFEPKLADPESKKKKILATIPQRKKRCLKKHMWKSKYIHPLGEAVDRKYSDSIADFIVKRTKYIDFCSEIEKVRKKMNLKSRDHEAIFAKLKSLMASRKIQKEGPKIETGSVLDK